MQTFLYEYRLRLLGRPFRGKDDSILQMNLDPNYMHMRSGKEGDFRGLLKFWAMRNKDQVMLDYLKEVS